MSTVKFTSEKQLQDKAFRRDIIKEICLGEENLEACNLQLVARGQALPALRLMQFLEMKGQLERALGGFFAAESMFTRIRDVG